MTAQEADGRLPLIPPEDKTQGNAMNLHPYTGCQARNGSHGRQSSVGSCELLSIQMILDCFIWKGPQLKK